MNTEDENKEKLNSPEETEQTEQTEQPDYSEGREMDDESKEQLEEKQEINNDFLDRAGEVETPGLDEYFSSETEENPGDSEKVEEPEQPEQTEQTDYSEGREMDDESKEQLEEKQEINNDFLDRAGEVETPGLDEYSGSETEENPGDSEKVEEPEQPEQPDYSEGREMDDASKEQLEEKQEINNDFLDRAGEVETPGLDEYLDQDSPEKSADTEQAEQVETQENTGDDQIR